MNLDWHPAQEWIGTVFFACCSLQVLFERKRAVSFNRFRLILINGDMIEECRLELYLR